MGEKLKMAQGQVWQQGDVYFRIVKWTRLSIDYKAMSNLATKAGEMHAVSKKAFCRLIKGAKLLAPEQVAELQAASAETPEPGSQEAGAADGMAEEPGTSAESSR